MARWKADHGMMALLLVGRIAGLSDQETQQAWKAGQRDKVIERALQTRSAASESN
jgi:hypothetical protein